MFHVDIVSMHLTDTNSCHLHFCPLFAIAVGNS
jgi:hypothetical protein